MNSGGKTFALQILSGKQQGGLHPLVPGRDMVIGRAAGLDLVLIEDMISRRHARISVREDELVLTDLGSTNGTFVNGERIEEVRLSEGDRILLGATILTVVSSPEEIILPSSSDFTPHGAMNGRLEEVSLPDLLQLFRSSQKTGTLHLQERDDWATIHLRKGRVVFASMGRDPTLPAEKAIYRILCWERGSFELRPAEEREFPNEIQETTEALLMESLRQLDEMRALRLPSRDAVLVLSPMAPPLRQLDAAELDLLQLALEQGRFGAILDKSVGTDLDVSRAILSLIEKGYLQVKNDAP